MSVLRFGGLLLLTGLIASMIFALPLILAAISAPQATAQSTSSVSEVQSDFNGDGFADLAIGVPGENIGPGNKSGAGTVHILYGSSPTGLQSSSPADQFLNQDIGSLKDAGENNDNYGSSLAAGDFNDDGFFDLAIGVPFEDISTTADAGAVHVLYGSSSGFQVFSSSDQFWHQNSPGVEDSVEAGELFGSSLVSGDFNNDGFDDMAVGSIFENVGGKLSAGAVNVLYGSSFGLQTSSPADQFWHQDKPGVEDTAENQELFGATLASGDFNGDGFDDLAIGVPEENVGAVKNAGAVNVLYASASGLQTTSPVDQFWHQNSPGVQDSPEDNDNLGAALSQE